jgi:hypothetical protein
MTRSVIFSHLLLCGAMFAQSASSPANVNKSSPAAPQASNTSAQAAGAATRVRYRPDRFAGRAGMYYRLIWGVDSLSVKWAESGEMIRFTYRVLDPNKAKTLSDKRVEPSLIDERAHVKLVVPMMDKVGKLRQTSTPEVGKTYWMLFSNKGGYVKHGDHVNVEIGNFHADGLVVD